MPRQWIYFHIRFPDHFQFVEQIGFPSTKDYVKAVMARRERYAAQFREANP